MSDRNAEKLALFRQIVLDNPSIIADEYDALQIKGKPSRLWLRRHLSSGWREAKLRIVDVDFEILCENVRLAKKTQKFQDTNRIERKSFREAARIENAIEAYTSELAKLLISHSLASQTTKHVSDEKARAIGVVHFSDAHFNELVELAMNRYDFTVASQRCQKLVARAKQYFSLFDIQHVLFAMTGDMLNSDRRLDELLNMATNRSKATFLAVEIIKHMIVDLNESFNVSVACVTGNESRVGKDFHWSHKLATDNYDFMIFNMLEYLFTGSEGVTFLRDDDPTEQVVSVGGLNVLLLHGNSPRVTGKVETSVQSIKGKWAAKGVIIHLVIFGHLHSCRIGDTYARSSSLVGGNDYSDKDLQLTSRASQNLHIVFDDQTWDSIRVDLQDTDGVDGYKITKELEAYNAKSASKLHAKKTILEITI